MKPFITKILPLTLLSLVFTLADSQAQGAFESEISQATPGAAGDEKTVAVSETDDADDAVEPEDGAPVTAQAERVRDGKVAVLDLTALENFDDQPEPVQELLEIAADLTEQGLGYKYGCALPEQGAMDCSGAIYYLLREAGVKNVPRSSLAQYRWVWEQNLFHGVNGESWDTFEMSELRPGHLLFWVGTYDTDRNPPVSHVMIYAGYDAEREKHVMFGSSEGRRFDGKKRYGVSAFDFDGPRKKSGFIGYAPVPGL